MRTHTNAPLSHTITPIIYISPSPLTPSSPLHCSLYSKAKQVALFLTNVDDAEKKKDGAVTQMRWDLDLIYSLWVSDEPGQQEGNACLNIILCDRPTVKTRTYKGTHQWQVVHAAPPIALSSMSTTHAYLRAEIHQGVVDAFMRELRLHYSPDTSITMKHIIRFAPPSSRSGLRACE